MLHRRHITVKQNVLSASLNKTFLPSFLLHQQRMKWYLQHLAIPRQLIAITLESNNNNINNINNINNNNNNNNSVRQFVSGFILFLTTHSPHLLTVILASVIWLREGAQ